MAIDRRWLPLNALRAFEAAARRGSFTAGAAALHVTQSALSRHVASLEALVGCRLVERRPGGLALTPAGAALLPAATKSFDRLEDALNGVMRDAGGPVRRLSLHMPPTFLQQVALPLLRDFRREFPDLPIDVSSSPVTGAPGGEVDAAVVYDRPRRDDAVRDLLWTVEVTPLCAPALAEGAAALGLEGFLRRHELLHVRLDGRPRDVLWAEFAARARVEVPTDRGLSFDTSALAVQYALSGAGVALADTRLFADLVAAGRLARPFDVVREDGYGYYLALHPEDVTEPGVALFRSWMIGRFAAADGG